MVGLARTIFIRCIYGTFGRESSNIRSYTVYIYTVIYGIYIRCIYTVLANPNHTVGVPLRYECKQVGCKKV